MSKYDKKAMREFAQAEKSKTAITNMAYKDSPPPFISLIGPEGSGKSTLLKSIAKHLWKKETQINGPVTIKISHKRYTFFEATNSLSNIIDTIKISDMIKLLINLKVGLQKKTLEAINMINSQGLPKVFFVCTNHNDKKAEKTFKEISKRIQKEFSFPMRIFSVDQDADSLIYNKIGKICRYIETMKYRPVEWKCTHPHIVVDQIKNGFVFGYVRGGPLNYEFEAHLPGYGDETIDSIQIIEDPCDLKGRSNAIYNPMGSENINESDEDSSAEVLDFSDENIKMFNDEDEQNFNLEESVKEENGSQEASQIEDSISEQFVPEDEDDNEETSEEDIGRLKNSLISRFKKTDLTEEELEEKFNEEYNEKNKDELPFLQNEKLKHYELKEEIEENSNLILPGRYVKIKIEKYNFDKVKPDLLIIGSYLPSENVPVILKGKILKNKWQKFDLKSNSPFFISMGWYRFQSIPLFIEKSKTIKYCKQSSEILFYGPNVPVGTSFFLFVFDSYYRIHGSGMIMDASGSNRIQKKLKLIGHPKSISGNNVVVQSMFSSDLEVCKFINAKLSTASGLRGLLKSSIGKDGCFRATFEGSLLMSEIIFLKCFVNANPYLYFKHITDNSHYIRPLKEIRSELGLPLYDDATDESENEDASNVEEFVDHERAKKSKLRRMEMKALERNLPFSQRTIKDIKETIKLPVPPEQRLEFERKKRIEARNLRIKEEEEQRLAQKMEAKRKRMTDEQVKEEERKRKNAVRGFLDKRKHKKHKR